MYQRPRLRAIAALWLLEFRHGNIARHSGDTLAEKYADLLTGRGIDVAAFPHADPGALAMHTASPVPLHRLVPGRPVTGRAVRGAWLPILRSKPPDSKQSLLDFLADTFVAETRNHRRD